MTTPEKIIVTKFRALVEYIKNKGLADDNTRHITHAKPSDLKGKHALGVLPFWLAAHAEMVTEIRLNIPLNRRGEELSLEEVSFYALPPATYKVIKIEEEES
jgi:hypothetical protein